LSSEIRVTSGASTTHTNIVNHSDTLLVTAGKSPMLVLAEGFAANPVPGPGKGQTRYTRGRRRQLAHSCVGWGLCRRRRQSPQPTQNSSELPQAVRAQEKRKSE